MTYLHHSNEILQVQLYPFSTGQIQLTPFLCGRWAQAGLAQGGTWNTSEGSRVGGGIAGTG